jgi:hypothetical protein
LAQAIGSGGVKLVVCDKTTPVREINKIVVFLYFLLLNQNTSRQGTVYISMDQYFDLLE